MRVTVGNVVVGVSALLLAAMAVAFDSAEAAAPTVYPLRAWINTVVPEYPNAIEFRAAFTGLLSPQQVNLEFGVVPVHPCDEDTVHSVRLSGWTTAVWRWDPAEGQEVPLDGTVWWRWRVVDIDGSVHVSETRQVVWTDQRFEWQSYTRDELTVHWHGKTAGFGENVVDYLESQLERIALIEATRRPVNIFVYESAADAGPGALLQRDRVNPYRTFNTVVSVIPEEFQGDEVTALVHELAHLMVQDRGFNCFTGLPHWLDEGLAMFAEGGVSEEMRRAFAEQRLFEQFVPLRSLDSPFSSDQRESALWYAQSYDMIEFLKEVFDWYGVGLLIDAFEEGRTVDEALRYSYGFGVDEIERQWRQFRDLPVLTPNRPIRDLSSPFDRGWIEWR